MYKDKLLYITSKIINKSFIIARQKDEQKLYVAKSEKCGTHFYLTPFTSLFVKIFLPIFSQKS